MPRRKRTTQPDDANNDQEVRRGKRQRIAKQRPDFVDPFSLRKKRMAASDSGTDEEASPFSPVSGDSSPQVEEKKLFECDKRGKRRGTDKDLPVRKRQCMRVTWPTPVLPCSASATKPHALPSASKPKDTTRNPQERIRIKIPIHITRPGIFRKE